MKRRVTVSFSEKDKDKLSVLAADLHKESKSYAISKLLSKSARQSILDDDSNIPMVFIIDGEQIKNKAAVRNEAFREGWKANNELIEQLESKIAELKNQAATTGDTASESLWDAVQLKPSLFGIGIDLKKLFKNGPNK